MPFTIKRKVSNDANENAEFALAKDNEYLDSAEINEFQKEITETKEAAKATEKVNASPENFKKAFLDGFIFKNPSLVDFVGLTPIIVGGTTVKNGLFLSVSTVIVLICVCTFASLTRNILPKKLAPAVYTVIASAVLVLLSYLGYSYFSSSMFSLGIVFPLIAVNGLNLSRAREFASKHNLKLSFADALGKGTGFSAVLILTSALREILGYGTFCNIDVPIFSHYHSLVASGIPGGFIAMAIFAAIVQYIALKNEKRGEKQNDL